MVGRCSDKICTSAGLFLLLHKGRQHRESHEKETLKLKKEEAEDKESGDEK